MNTENQDFSDPNLNQSQCESDYWENWKRVTTSEEFKAIQEANVILHLAKYGSVPETGIPIIDVLKHMGPCPCLQCWRDEFIS